MSEKLKDKTYEEKLVLKAMEVREKRVTGKEPGYTWKEIDDVLRQKGIVPGTQEATEFMNEWDIQRAKELLEQEEMKQKEVELESGVIKNQKVEEVISKIGDDVKEIDSNEKKDKKEFIVKPHIITKGLKKCVIIGGNKGKLYDKIRDLQVTPDGKPIYIAKDGPTERVVIGNSEGNYYDKIESLIINPDGTIAYFAKDKVFREFFDYIYEEIECEKNDQTSVFSIFNKLRKIPIIDFIKILGVTELKEVKPFVYTAKYNKSDVNKFTIYTKKNIASYQKSERYGDINVITGDIVAIASFFSDDQRAISFLRNKIIEAKMDFLNTTEESKNNLYYDIESKFYELISRYLSSEIGATEIFSLAIRDVKCKNRSVKVAAVRGIINALMSQHALVKENPDMVISLRKFILPKETNEHPWYYFCEERLSRDIFGEVLADYVFKLTKNMSEDEMRLIDKYSNKWRRLEEDADRDVDHPMETHKSVPWYIKAKYIAKLASTVISTEFGGVRKSVFKHPKDVSCKLEIEREYEMALLLYPEDWEGRDYFIKYLNLLLLN